MEDHLQAALAFLHPDETAAQFLARSFVEQIHTGVPLIDLRAPLRATNVVEISGLASTGKTEILYSVRFEKLLYYLVHECLRCYRQVHENIQLIKNQIIY